MLRLKEFQLHFSSSNSHEVASGCDGIGRCTLLEADPFRIRSQVAKSLSGALLAHPITVSLMIACCSAILSWFAIDVLLQPEPGWENFKTNRQLLKVAGFQVIITGWL